MISLFERFYRSLPRMPPERPMLSDDLWTSACSGVNALNGLSIEQAALLRQLAGRFLRDKIFEPAGGMVLDDAKRGRIAALACLPILGLGYHWYEGWRTLIVYPGEFVKPRSEFDAIGVLHQWEDVLTGESWERGPVMLSWADVAASGHHAGHNVVIHEMAHKLDMRNGAPDGFPPLHKHMDRRVWNEQFSAAFADLNARLDRGEDTNIDPYAAEAPAEFFAVLSEYFFELPGLVRTEYPVLYDLLAEFYRQNPAARLDLETNGTEAEQHARTQDRQ